MSKALHRFHAELKYNNEGVFDVQSLEELLDQARRDALSSGGKSLIAFRRMEPILSHFSDFAAVVAICSGADAKVSGLVWGSLRVIFRVSEETSHSVYGADTHSLLFPLATQWMICWTCSTK